MIHTGSQSKENQISLLYVDDEQDLLEIGKFFLERSGKFRVDIMTSALEALKTSDIQSYDAIISDYQMPAMDGITFLKTVRGQFGDIPFILFTGRGREEVVIDAINNGADFYLQKGGEPKPQFAELSHKILQAVKRKQAERSLLNSEKELADIINFLPDATFAIDQSGRVIAWNRAIEDMTGIPASDMLGKGNYEYAIPFYGSRRHLLIDLINEPEEKLAQFYSNAYRAGNSLIAETNLPHPKGNLITVLAKACLRYNNAGESIGAIESIRDITELKKIELHLRMSEEKFRNLVEYSRDCILIVDFEGNVHFLNRTGLLMVEEDDFDTIIGKKNIMEYVHPESREDVIKDINQVFQGNDAYISQYKIITAKKREIWVESQGRKIPYQQSEAILVSLRDVTERKRAEDVLKESEEHFRALTEQSPDIIVRVDHDYRILYCNPKITDYTGIPADHLIGKDSRKCIGHEDITASWIRAVQKVFETGTSAHEEWKLESGYWFDCLCYPEFGPDNTVRAVTSSVRNITDTKRIEEERDIYYRDLIVRRELTRALLDAIPIPVHSMDMNRRFTGCNKAGTKFFGISQQELIGKTFEEIWQFKEEITHINLHDDELILNGYIHPYQTKLTDRAGLTHEVIISKNLFHDYQGNIAGIVGSIQDVTDQNQLILNLKSREELFRMILSQSSDIFIIVTPHLDISYISSRIENLSGFMTEELLGPLHLLVHQDDFKKISDQIERLIQNPSSTEIAEFRSKKRDGTYMLLEGVAVNCIDNPAIRGILVTARNTISL
jgi:PAS domain S-box-containing protein